MMTSYQRSLFNQLLEYNYELSVGDYSSVVQQALIIAMSKVEIELEQDMGVKEWREFKDKGRRMFSPA